MPADANALHIPAAFESLDVSGFRRLDDVTVGVFDCPHSTPALSDRGPLVVRTQDIMTGVLRVDQAAHVSEETYRERIVRAEPEFGDLLYSREGTYFGIAADVPSGTRLCLGQRMVLIRPDRGKVDHRYLKYWLNSPQIAGHIHGFRDGSVAERLNLPVIRGLPVFVPELSEQRAVAETLGALDDKIEQNRRTGRKLEELARAVFKAWFVDFEPVKAKAAGATAFPSMPPETFATLPTRLLDSPLGPVPEEWEVKPIGDLASFILGGDWGKDSETAETPDAACCIRGADIPDLWANGMGKMPVRFLKRGSLEKRTLRDGDIVVEISGGSPTQSTGRPVLVRDALLNELTHPLVCSNFCRIFRPRPKLSLYTYFLFRWMYDTEQFLQYENGTTGIKNFAFTKFCEVHAVIEPVDGILSAFDISSGPILDLMAHFGAESRKLAALRDYLLPRLLSGRVRVRDAETALGRTH